MLTDGMIARCFAREFASHLEESTPPFRCHIEFEMAHPARTMTVDNFWDWHVRPNVLAALCYAENGAGGSLEMPPNVPGGIERHLGAEVRYVHAFDLNINRTRHRLDIRYQP